MKTIQFTVSHWPSHLPGQHADVRLTAEDGYRAERSYSIASPPEVSGLELTVDRLEDGEVSPFLTDQLQPDDTIQLRGPIGGYFVWSASEHRRPLLLVAGGTGVVPLMSVLQAARYDDAQSSRERYKRAEQSHCDTRSRIRDHNVFAFIMCNVDWPLVIPGRPIRSSNRPTPTPAM